MKLFDSHCHLHFPQFNEDREEVIKKLRDLNVAAINVGTDLEDSKKALELVKKHSDVMWAAVGIHPTDKSISTSWRRSSASGIFEQLKKLAKDEKVVAIGECGLDYAFQKKASAEVRQLANEGGLSEEKIKDLQKEIFIKQIELARELNKPLILHCRPSAGTQDAYEDAFDILNNVGFNNGVMHFFSGSRETAKKFLNLSGSARSREARGFYIGFAGPITFRPAGDHPKGGSSPYKEIVEFVPMDRILIETDAPFAAPAPRRGRRNEPAYVEFVARKIAEWSPCGRSPAGGKNLSFEEIAVQTTENAKKLFNIK